MSDDKQHNTVGSKNGSRHPVIDNRKYPSSEELAKIFHVPAGRVRQLKALAKEILETEEVRP